MSLSTSITPLTCSCSTSDTLMTASHVKKKKNSTALCLEECKERIKKMLNNVELSISSYDTAWVAMVPSSTSPDAPFFPQCLNWLLDNQHFDGSWGLPSRDLSFTNEALLSTLACVLALKKWGVGEDQINKGLQFIDSNIASIEDDKHQRPTGFDLLFPSLIEYAQNLGINFPISATSLEAIIRRRDIELTRGNESNSEGWGAYLAYVSEGMQKLQDWETVLKYQRKNGSLFNSPATTAAAFHQLKNTDCLNYLQSVLEKFGKAAVPTIYPLDIYVRLCMIDHLERLGVNRHFKDEIRSVLDETYRNWQQGVEDIFLDPTTCAMAFRLLRLNGYHVSSDPFYQYSEDNFSDSLKGYLKDASAILELYKASQVILHPDESILVRQNAWTIHLLNQKSTHYQLYADKCRSYAEQEVNDALTFPYYANVERILNIRSMKHYNVQETRILKSSYRSKNLANQEFLKLAAEDFNICQSIQKEELKELSRWVMESKLDKLEFARQKLAYCYFSAAAIYFAPELSDVRISLTKKSVLVTIVDDFYDVGSTEDEKLNLVQLMEDWDVDIDSACCSENVKIIFCTIRSAIQEIRERAVKWQGRNVEGSIIKTWLSLIRSMLMEANWSKTKTVPTLDEYMQNAYVSFGLGPIVLPALFLVGPKLSGEAAETQELHCLFETMSTCGRLLNDINTFEVCTTSSIPSFPKLRLNYGDIILCFGRYLMCDPITSSIQDLCHDFS
ncbi:hypothetical protein PIB30_047971 [Stylosanthes scabra]|uniref:Ent-kaurene synthase n=1 Tax=Stylosanthes scabra TaxID=79078 RepID=A0ABU6RH24_9FABA|nr:hypothetical protein [Stylosanthes scabra]